MDRAVTSPLDDAPELCRLSAREMTDRYRSATASPVETVDAALTRCEAVQARFNAFTQIDHEGARSAAADSAARWRAGAPLSPIDGVPATIKDIVWVRDRSIRYGSSALPPVVAKEDAPSVARLRAAGAVIVGITTTPELGWKALTDSPEFGETLNPHDPALTPGGSSGGAAVAAVTGCAPFNLGTDGGGSIRVPASFCGAVGVKPTFGRVPAYPASAFGTVAHIGPMARTAEDAGIMLDAMSGRDTRDWHQPLMTFAPASGERFAFPGARVGVWREPPGGKVAPDVAEVFEAALARLADAGAILEEHPLPNWDARCLFETHWFSGAAARLADVPAEAREGMDPGLLAIAQRGGEISAPALAAAHRKRGDYGAALDAWVAEVDLIVSPAVAVTPFESGREVPTGWDDERWTSWAGFSFPINLGQHPAAVAPGGIAPGGQPVGIQFVAGRGDDARVVAAAAAWEQLTS